MQGRHEAQEAPRSGFFHPHHSPHPRPRHRVPPPTPLPPSVQRVAIEGKTLRFCYDRLTSLLKTLEITGADEYGALHLVADFATLVGTYSRGFAIIVEPYDERLPSVRAAAASATGGWLLAAGCCSAAGLAAAAGWLAAGLAAAAAGLAAAACCCCC